MSPTLITTMERPRDLEQVEGAGAKDLITSGPQPGRPPFISGRQSDMEEGTRTRHQAHSTPPWGQHSRGWPHGGVLVFSGASGQPSYEGVEMT